MEILNEIWNYVLPIGGFTLGAVVVGVASLLLKSVVTKAIGSKMSEIDIKGIEEKAVAKGIEQVKTVSFKQSIQPIVNSELEKVYENVAEKLQGLFAETEKRQAQTILILEKLSAYFDNSIGVPDTAKEELRKAILDTKSSLPAEVLTEVEQVVEEVVNLPKTAQKSIGVER